MYYVAPEMPMMSSVIADCPDLVPPNILNKSTPMLSPVLSLKPQNTTTSFLLSRNSTGSKFLNELNNGFKMSDLLFSWVNQLLIGVDELFPLQWL